MSSFKKMVLVPANADVPLETRKTELDNQMNTILNRQDLSDDEKIKLYQQVLGLYLRINKDNHVKSNSKNESNQDPLSSLIDLNESTVSPLKPAAYYADYSSELKNKKLFDESYSDLNDSQLYKSFNDKNDESFSNNSLNLAALKRDTKPLYRMNTSINDNTINDHTMIEEEDVHNKTPNNQSYEMLTPDKTMESSSYLKQFLNYWGSSKKADNLTNVTQRKKAQKFQDWDQINS